MVLEGQVRNQCMRVTSNARVKLYCLQSGALSSGIASACLGLFWYERFSADVSEEALVNGNDFLGKGCCVNTVELNGQKITWKFLITSGNTREFLLHCLNWGKYFW